MDDQISWYSKKSSRNKKLFNNLRFFEIILALLVPFLGTFLTEEVIELKYVVSLVGVLIAAIAGLISLMKYQEFWIEYRITAQSLKHEKYLFLTQSGPYEGGDGFHLFVERIESLISKENSKWAQVAKRAVEEKQDK